MADLFEVLMLIAFGVSWPINIRKAWTSKSTQGISLFFYILIDLGYVAGIVSKVFRIADGVPVPWYVWFFYILNLIMVSIGIGIYFRNKQLEKKIR